jgi:hypothetical protein
VTLEIRSTAALEGVVLAVQGAFGLVGRDLHLGDQHLPTLDEGIRAFTSFDLSEIPADATITAASLQLLQSKVAGTPFTSLGPVLVDQVVYGNVLDVGAYSRSFPSNQGLGPLTVDATLGPRALDVSTVVQEAVAVGRTQLQFRLYCPFETDFDDEGDQVHFKSSASAQSEDERPTLVVTYTR